MIRWTCPKCAATLHVMEGAINVTCGGRDKITDKMVHRPCKMKRDKT